MRCCLHVGGTPYLKRAAAERQGGGSNDYARRPSAAPTTDGGGRLPAGVSYYFEGTTISSGMPTGKSTFTAGVS